MPYPPLTIGHLISTVYEDNGSPIEIPDHDRTKPIYLIGKPNTGKSTVMLNSIAQDIDAGAGLVFIEYETNLTPTILDLIPKERFGDVVLLDFADHNFPLSLNLFAGYHQPEQETEREQLIQMLMQIAGNLWAESWGTAVRMRRVLNYTFATLTHYPDATFLSIPRLLEDESYRTHVLEHVSDETLRNFWDRYTYAWKERDRREATEPILNRIEQLFINKPARHVLCQPKTTIDFAHHIKDGRIIIANLGRRKNSPPIASLFGALLFAKLYLTALHLHPDHTPPFTFYLDDFTEYALPVFPTTFSQSPHMRFMLAHQHAGQLEQYKNVRSTILGSAGMVGVFQVSHLDADSLTQELDLDRASDHHTPQLTHVPDHTAVIKVTQDGETETRYMRTAPPPDPRHSLRDVIRTNSRTLYATPRHDIERQISAWYAPVQEGDSAALHLN